MTYRQRAQLFHSMENEDLDLTPNAVSVVKIELEKGKKEKEEKKVPLQQSLLEHMTLGPVSPSLWSNCRPAFLAKLNQWLCSLSRSCVARWLGNTSYQIDFFFCMGGAEGWGVRGSAHPSAPPRPLPEPTRVKKAGEVTNWQPAGAEGSPVSPISSYS